MFQNCFCFQFHKPSTHPYQLLHSIAEFKKHQHSSCQGSSEAQVQRNGHSKLTCLSSPTTLQKCLPATPHTQSLQPPRYLSILISDMDLGYAKFQYAPKVGFQSVRPWVLTSAAKRGAFPHMSLSGLRIRNARPQVRSPLARIPIKLQGLDTAALATYLSKQQGFKHCLGPVIEGATRMPRHQEQRKV